MAERLTTATVHWDEDADEVEIVLDGIGPREGIAVLRDVYVRYDVDTGEMLSVIIHGIERPLPMDGNDE